MTLGITRTQLNFCLMGLMIIDHVAWLWLDGFWAEIFHLFGRAVMPLFCYFLVLGYQYTSNKKAYAKRLFLFALISQPFTLVFSYFIHFPFEANVIFTFFIGFLVLYAVEWISKTLKQSRSLEGSVLFVMGVLPFIGGLCVGLWYAGKYFSYGVGIWVALVGLYFVTRQTKNQWIHAFSLLILFALAHYITYRSYQVSQLNFMLWGWLLVIPLVGFYRPDWGAGSRHWLRRYTLYLFYPLHFGVLNTIYWLTSY